MKLRVIAEAMYRNNDQELSRSLLESVVVPEITQAIGDWINAADIPGVLIGGLALSFYVKPRATMDIDIVYASDADIPENIRGFKRTRSHSFQHNRTHVEVEVLSPEFLGVPAGLVKQVIATAETSNGMRIASKSGLVALKLQRGKRQDQADIEQLIQSGGVDLAPFERWLTPKQIQLYQEILNDS